jgi:hypothetical protein
MNYFPYPPDEEYAAYQERANDASHRDFKEQLGLRDATIAELRKLLEEALVLVRSLTDPEQFYCVEARDLSTRISAALNSGEKP